MVYIIQDLRDSRFVNLSYFGFTFVEYADRAHQFEDKQSAIDCIKDHFSGCMCTIIEVYV